MALADFAHSVLMHRCACAWCSGWPFWAPPPCRSWAAALPDIPRASLYRHLRTLTDLGYLTVVEETRVRGRWNAPTP